MGHSGTFLRFENFCAGHGIECGGAEPIHGLRGQGDELPEPSILAASSRPSEPQRPGSSIFQLAIERVLSLLTPKLLKAVPIAGCVREPARRRERAAFFAPATPIANVATGIPAGICTMDSSESIPLNARL